jgi:HAMP domain-containing protein
MDFLRRVAVKSNLKYVLLSLIALPVLLSISLAVDVVNKDYQALRKIMRVDETIHLGIDASGVINAIQLEHGASTVFLSSEGKTFSAELTRYRSATDVVLKDFKQASQHIDNNYVSARAMHQSETLNSLLSKLNAVRQNVDQQKMETADMAVYYSQINTSLLGYYYAALDVSHMPIISKGIVAVTNFQLAQESAALERAVGAVNFGKGVFDTEALIKFNELIVSQAKYFEEFRAYATQEDVTLLDGFERAPIVAQVDEMRQLALHTAVGMPIPTISAKDFFDAQTKRIGLLHGIVNTLNTRLMANIDAQIDKSDWAFKRSSILIAIGVVISTTLAFFIAAAISTELKRVARGAKELANGNLEVKFPKAGKMNLGN